MQQQPQALEIPPPQPQQISPQFLEPPQYVQAISVQPMIANFPSPTVLSPLQVGKKEEIISNGDYFSGNWPYYRYSTYIKVISELK